MKLIHALRRQAAFAVGFSVLACMSAHAALAPQLGAQATYRDVFGEEWCVTVQAIGSGPDLDTWVWFSFNANPGRIEHAPLGQLTAGCRP